MMTELDWSWLPVLASLHPNVQCIIVSNCPRQLQLSFVQVVSENFSFFQCGYGKGEDALHNQGNHCACPKTSKDTDQHEHEHDDVDDVDDDWWLMFSKTFIPESSSTAKLTFDHDATPLSSSESSLTLKDKEKPPEWFWTKSKFFTTSFFIFHFLKPSFWYSFQPSFTPEFKRF